MSAVLELTAKRLLTADEVFAMPNTKFGVELVKGELIRKMPTGILPGIIVARLAAALSVFVRQRKLGEVLGAETGFKLQLNPDTLRAPDVSFLSREKFLQVKNISKFFSGAPDLAIEVISPSETFQDVQEKIEEYLAAGVPLIWIIRPKQLTITVYRPNRELKVLHEADELDGEDIIPGFHCLIEEILGDLPQVSE